MQPESLGVVMDGGNLVALQLIHACSLVSLVISAATAPVLHPSLLIMTIAHWGRMGVHRVLTLWPAQN